MSSDCVSWRESPRRSDPQSHHFRVATSRAQNLPLSRLFLRPEGPGSCPPFQTLSVTVHSCQVFLSFTPAPWNKHSRCETPRGQVLSGPTCSGGRGGVRGVGGPQLRVSTGHTPEGGEQVWRGCRRGTTPCGAVGSRGPSSPTLPASAPPEPWECLPCSVRLLSADPARHLRPGGWRCHRVRGGCQAPASSPPAETLSSGAS